MTSGKHSFFALVWEAPNPLILSNHRPVRFPFGWIFILGLIQLINGSSVRATGDILGRVPEDALLVVHIRDIQGINGEIINSPLGAFWGDPRVEPYFKPLRSKLDWFRDAFLAGFDVHYPGLKQFLNGEALFALLPVPGNDGGQAVEWILMLEHNGNDSVLQYLNEKPSGKGADIRTHELSENGLSFNRIFLKPDPDNEPVADISRSQGLRYDLMFGDDFLLFAGVHGEPIRRILGRERPGTDLDSPVAVWINNLETQLKEQPGILNIYLNLAVLYNWYRDKHHAYLTKRGMNLDGLGLGSFRDLNLKVVLDARKVTIDIVLTSTGGIHGISKLLFIPEIPVESASHLVPASVGYYSAATYPVMQSWLVLKDTCRSSVPALYPALESQLRTIEEDSGFRIMEDLLSHLTGRTVHVRLSGEKADTSTESGVYMLEIRDPARFCQSLRAILDLGSRLTNAYHLEWTKTARGSSWTLRKGRADIAVSGGAIFYGCHVDNWFICGTSSAPIGKIIGTIGGATRPLSEQEPYQSVMRRMSPSRYWEGYIGLSMLAQGLTRKIFGTMTAFDPGQQWPVMGVLDMQRQPSREVWDNYFGPVGLARSITDNGVEIRAVMQWP